MATIIRNLVLRYRSVFGNRPNLHAPKLYREKITWKMAYDRDLLLRTTTDKIAVCEYVKNKGFDNLLIPFAFCTDNPEEFINNDLSNMIIKPSHLSGLHLSGSCEKKDIIKNCNQWLEMWHLPQFEWAYQKIHRKIIVQELLGGRLQNDYKFFVCNGVCKYWYTGSVFNKWCNVYNVGGQFLKVKRGNYTNNYDAHVPDNLQEMLYIAEILGKDFDFVRVDLYSYKGKIYFGELTHYPTSGLATFIPHNFNYELCKEWKVNENNNNSSRRTALRM